MCSQSHCCILMQTHSYLQCFIIWSPLDKFFMIYFRSLFHLMIFLDLEMEGNIMLRNQTIVTNSGPYHKIELLLLVRFFSLPQSIRAKPKNYNQITSASEWEQWIHHTTPHHTTPHHTTPTCSLMVSSAFSSCVWSISVRHSWSGVTGLKPSWANSPATSYQTSPA